MRESDAGDIGSVDKATRAWICRENIKDLRRQLEASRDEARRHTLLILIAEQEAALRNLEVRR
jgi:hypothetical protein